MDFDAGALAEKIKAQTPAIHAISAIRVRNSASNSRNSVNSTGTDLQKIREIIRFVNETAESVPAILAEITPHELAAFLDISPEVQRLSVESAALRIRRDSYLRY